MRFLSIAEILDIHERLLADSGGASGVRDLGALESAASQPHAVFGGRDLYPDLVAKAAALCFRLSCTIPSWTEINGSAMPRWKRSLF
jgi:death-on-curing protein